MSDHTIWIGPAKISWIKYQFAKLCLNIILLIPYGAKIPIGNELFNWSLKVLIGSRDIKTIENN